MGVLRTRLMVLTVLMAVFVVISAFLNLDNQDLLLHAKARKDNKIIYRLIDHRKSYKEIPSTIEHIQIKVTPPEQRGQQSMVLVETYNKTKTRIGSMTFDIVMLNKEVTGSEELFINAEAKLPGGWGSAREWYKIKRQKTIISSLELRNIEIYSVDDKNNIEKMTVPIIVDLIKN